VLDISHFDAWALPRQARPNAWERFSEGLDWHIAPHGIGAHPEADRIDDIKAQARRWRAPGGFEMVNVRAEAQTLRTGERRRPNEYWLALVVTGSVRVRNGDNGDVATLAPGDMVFGARGHCILFEIAEAASIEIVHLPRSGRVPRFLASSALKPLQRLHPKTGASRLLGTVLDAVARAFSEMGEAEVRAIEISISEFFIAALAAQPNQRDLTTSRAVLLGRAHEAIDLRLRDAGISPASIAPELSLSPRYLQKLLNEGGEAFNLYVRRRRLESVHEELMNPVYFRESISEICFRWGFNDSAYFSRVFKNHFGLSPSQHRENWKRHDATCDRTRGHRAFVDGVPRPDVPEEVR
jgi:AraC-like DNA-binding protein